MQLQGVQFWEVAQSPSRLFCRPIKSALFLLIFGLRSFRRRVAWLHLITRKATCANMLRSYVESCRWVCYYQAEYGQRPLVKKCQRLPLRSSPYGDIISSHRLRLKLGAPRSYFMTPMAGDDEIIDGSAMVVPISKGSGCSSVRGARRIWSYSGSRPQPLIGPLQH